MKMLFKSVIAFALSGVMCVAVAQSERSSPGSLVRAAPEKETTEVTFITNASQKAEQIELADKNIRIATSTTTSQTRGHYSLKKSNRTNEFVKTVDLDAIRINYLSKYELQSKTEDKSGVKRMVVYDKESRKKVEVRILLLPSVKDACNSVLDLLNGASVLFNDGTPSGHAIGDNVWYLTTKETGATTIFFVRKNVVGWLFAQDGPVAETLAQKLDADILSGKNGVELKDRQ